MHDIAAHVCVWGLISNPAWTEAGGELLKPSLSGAGKYWSTDEAKHTANAKCKSNASEGTDKWVSHLGQNLPVWFDPI